MGDLGQGEAEEMEKTAGKGGRAEIHIRQEAANGRGRSQ